MTEPSSVTSDHSADPSQPSPSPDIWRNEIQSRVAGYRSRKGRRVEGAFSMRFPFPAAGPEASAPTVVGETCESGERDRLADAPAAQPPGISPATPDATPQPGSYLAVESLPAEQSHGLALPGDEPLVEMVPEPVPELAPSPKPSSRAKRKVLAFPRPTSAPQPAYRLADPVVPEQPRILDVPEELEAFPTTPLLDGLQLPASAQQAVAAPPDHVELPFQAARISRRITAGLIDALLVAVGSGAFAAVAYKMLPRITPTKPLLLTVATLPVLLWAAYQYLFLMYSAVTPGMRMMRMRLRTFKGGQPNWRHRRSRVIGLYFSAASLLMGLLWALVDVDVLCWHDRISHTYVTDQL